MGPRSQVCQLLLAVHTERYLRTPNTPYFHMRNTHLRLAAAAVLFASILTACTMKTTTTSPKSVSEAVVHQTLEAVRA